MIFHLLTRYLPATGACACVGMMGPGLGGGHGRYQGQYGLISDNLVNLNVVLADGSSIRVNETEHTDLWW
jgi:FAD/FMN-containing dehydrogenase